MGGLLRRRSSQLLRDQAHWRQGRRRSRWERRRCPRFAAVLRLAGGRLHPIIVLFFHRTYVSILSFRVAFDAVYFLPCRPPRLNSSFPSTIQSLFKIFSPPSGFIWSLRVRSSRTLCTTRLHVIC